MNRLAVEKVSCLDVETSGLDWRRHAIVGYVLAFSGDPRDSYYVPFRHAGNANVGGRDGLKSATGWDGKTLPGEGALIKAIDRQQLTFGHNLAFDLKFMSRVGFQLRPRFEDTMINEPLLDEFVGRYSLQSCAFRHKVQAKKSEEIVAYLRNKLIDIKTDKEAMGHFWRLAGNDRMAIEYASGDGTTTWQLRDAQMAAIDRLDKEHYAREGGDFQDAGSPTLRRVHSVESRLIPVLARMMIRGIKVDEERLDALIRRIDAGVEQLKNEFPSGFNALSKTDVRAWMERHGHTDWPTTAPSRTFPQGQPSFTEDFLSRYPAGQKVIKVRKLENLKATFCVPLRERHLWKGRVHTSFNQLRTDDYGTVTGRLSSNDPNLQQVPKHNEELGRLFRSVFVPDFGLWGERDYSQIEPRLMAYYTRARVFLDDYRNNPKADSHTAVSKAANPNWDKLDKAEQKHYRNNFGKRINQTVITGGGKGVIVQKYKVPPGEVDRMLSIYHRTVPELKPFQKRAARRFRQRGYVVSLLGRYARLDDPDRDYTALNRLLQCGNADILKLKMCEVDEYLEGERKGGQRAPVEMLLNCHDALSFQFDAAARPMYDHCKGIMQDFASDAAVIKLDLPITVDEGEGHDWAIATYGDAE
jgi:DNA polymerase I-like protein with 3'-5' exonuclease and polymerase domains